MASTFPEIGKQVCMIGGTQQGVASALEAVLKFVFPDEYSSGEPTMVQAVIPSKIGSAIRAKTAELQSSTGCDVAVGLKEIAPEEQVMDIYGNLQSVPMVFDQVMTAVTDSGGGVAHLSYVEYPDGGSPSKSSKGKEKGKGKSKSDGQGKGPSGYADSSYDAWDSRDSSWSWVSGKDS